MSVSDFQPREGDSDEIAGAVGFLRSCAIETLLSALSVEPVRSTMSAENGFCHTIGHLFGLHLMSEDLFQREIMNAIGKRDSKYFRAVANALDAVIKYQTLFPPPHNSPPAIRSTTAEEKRVLHEYALIRVLARHLRETGARNGGKVEPITKKELRGKVELLLQKEGEDPFADGKFWAELFFIWENRGLTAKEKGGGRPRNSVGKKPR